MGTKKGITYGRQSIDDHDIREVVRVLKSDWLTQGPKVAEFEKAFARYCGSRYAVAVSSGTAALHLACLAAGLKKGDEAVTSPVTFMATANAVVYAGGRPVFADIDLRTGNIDPGELEKRINQRTKAVLPVHFAGLPCDMPRIAAAAKRGKLTVIEDACHALGAAYRHQGRRVKVGSCRHSAMTVFSFHPLKTITTGEGGMITTNDKGFYERLRALRTHGVTKTPGMAHSVGSWYHEMRELGFNYRITDVQCALGLSQLKKAVGFIAKRTEIAKAYSEALQDIDGLVLPDDGGQGKRHGWHLYVLRVDFAKRKTTRKKFMERLQRKGVQTQVHYIPLYRQPFYRKYFRLSPKDFPCAEGHYAGTVSIPLHPRMDTRQVRHVIKSLRKELKSS